MDEDQFLVCEACGFVHCKSGDWVSLRLAGPLILIMPAFESYAENEDANTEYSPPWYIRKKGIPYFDLPTYESLRLRHPVFPSGGSIRKMNMREAILTYQGESPLQVFGRPPRRFAYRDDIIIAASEGEHTEHIQRIEEFARNNLRNEGTINLRLVSEEEKLISLYLDTAGFPEWRAVAYDGDEMRLVLDSRYVIVNADAV